MLHIVDRLLHVNAAHNGKILSGEKQHPPDHSRSLRRAGSHQIDAVRGRQTEFGGKGSH